MDVIQALSNRVARVLRCDPATIDRARLNRAVGHVNRKSARYYDALAEHCQLDGNVPFSMCVALVYDAE